MASVMLASGQSRRIAWGASVLLGAATFAGVLTMALLQARSEFWIAAVGRGDDLCGGVRPDSGSQPRAGSENGAGRISWSGIPVPAGSRLPTCH